VLRIIWNPVRNSREVWLSDGAGRIRLKVIDSKIGPDAKGELRVVRHVDGTDDACRLLDRFDRVVLEPLP